MNQRIDPQTTLRILQTTDLHMSLLPYDYTTDQPSDGCGLSLLAPMLDQLREDDIATCLFDTGDFLQGNPLADFIMRKTPPSQPHPMIAAMNALRYDAVSLGNHEFDYGLVALTHALSDLECPAVLANVTDTAGVPFFAPTTVITREVTTNDGQQHVLRIGVIGLVTPNIVLIDDDIHQDHLQASGMRDCAEYHATLLKRQGADITVALCHAGIAEHLQFETATQIASLPDIDVILAGHVHGVFPDSSQHSTVVVDYIRGTLHGKPAIMAGAFGKHMGQLDLRLAHINGSWQIVDHQAQIIATPLQNQMANTTIADLAIADHQHTLIQIRRPVAHTQTHIHSYFAQIKPDQSLQLVADANRMAIKAALTGTPYADFPILTVAAPQRVGGLGGPSNYTDVPEGPVKLRDARAIFPFDNKLVIARQTTDDIVARLEHAACQYLQIKPEQGDQLLIDTRFAPYNADTIFGLTYKIDLSKPAGLGRVNDVRHCGRLLNTMDSFIIGMSSYRAHGGGGYHPVQPDDIIHISPLSIYDHLVAYLETSGTVAPKPEPVWSFNPIPSASAAFHSSPHAAQHLPDISTANITLEGAGPKGFDTYRLHF